MTQTAAHALDPLLSGDSQAPTITIAPPQEDIIPPLTGQQTLSSEELFAAFQKKGFGNYGHEELVRDQLNPEQPKTGPTLESNIKAIWETPYEAEVAKHTEGGMFLPDKPGNSNAPGMKTLEFSFDPNHHGTSVHDAVKAMRERTDELAISLPNSPEGVNTMGYINEAKLAHKDPMITAKIVTTVAARENTTGIAGLVATSFDFESLRKTRDLIKSDDTHINEATLVSPDAVTHITRDAHENAQRINRENAPELPPHAALHNA